MPSTLECTECVSKIAEVFDVSVTLMILIKFDTFDNLMKWADLTLLIKH